MLALGIASWTAQAATIGELARATVPVIDSSESEFLRGLSAALEVVVVKLTGNSKVLQSGALRDLLNRAKQYNTVYGYEKSPDGGLQLRADFDLPAVSGVLRQQGFAVWGRQRPEFLAWLVVTDSTGRYATPTIAHKPLFEALERQAELRAIPLRRPVVDSANAALMAPATAEDDLLEGLTATRSGQSAPVILIGLVTQNPDSTWRARWRLQIDDEREEWQATNAQAMPVVIAGIDRAVDSAAKHFVHPEIASAANDVELLVDDVQTADDYGRALNYLSDLDSVATLNVRKVEGARVTFAIKSRGGLPALVQVISFGRVLQPVVGQPSLFTLLGH